MAMTLVGRSARSTDESRRHGLFVMRAMHICPAVPPGGFRTSHPPACAAALSLLSYRGRWYSSSPSGFQETAGLPTPAGAIRQFDAETLFVPCDVSLSSALPDLMLPAYPPRVRPSTISTSTSSPTNRQRRSASAAAGRRPLPGGDRMV